MRGAHTSRDRSFLHSRGENTYRETQHVTDWLAEYLYGKSEKEVADLTGLGLSGAKNLRLGKNGISGTALTNLLTNDPEFRARYFEFCGGVLPTSPEAVGTLHRLLNDLQRSGG